MTKYGLIDDESRLLTKDQEFLVLNAWKEAPTVGTDIICEWERFEIGFIATVLTMDGTANSSGWDADDGSESSDS